MRWICKDNIELNLTVEWLEKAGAVSNEIKSATTHQERKTILKKSSSIWREFYNLLPETLKKKCWYCEAEEIRSDMAIDHFRPKSKVEGVCLSR